MQVKVSIYYDKIKYQSLSKVNLISKCFLYPVNPNMSFERSGDFDLKDENTKNYKRIGKDWRRENYFPC